MLKKKTASQCASAEYSRGWNDAVDAMPRWIPVNERLPDIGVNVLLLHPHLCEWDDSLPTVECIVVTGEVRTAFGCKKKKAWSVHHTEYDIGAIRDLSYATHWMTIPTLPKLPKEEEMAW